jgi:hypothetical protein
MRSLFLNASRLLALPLLAASLSLSAQSGAKAAPTKSPASPGVSISTGGTQPPPGAKVADIQDVRVLTGKEDTDPYQLERVAVTFAQNGDVAKARELLEKAWKAGELPSAPFNLAGLDVREKKIDAAFRQLDRAIAAGFDDEQMLQADTDLAPIRNDPRFARIVAAARKNAAAGDAFVVANGTFLPPQGAPAAIILLLHDASSDPLAITNPFLAQARAKGLFVAAPRGPARAGKKRFGWGSPERAVKAVGAAILEARKRSGANLPVIAAGIGRGGMVVLYVATTQPGVLAGAASIGGPFDPKWIRSEEALAGLKKTKLFFGVSLGTSPLVLQGFRQGKEGLKGTGVPIIYQEWPGTGDGLPTDAAKAVSDVLSALTGR